MDIPVVPVWSLQLFVTLRGILIIERALREDLPLGTTTIRPLRHPGAASPTRIIQLQQVGLGLISWAGLQGKDLSSSRW